MEPDLQETGVSFKEDWVIHRHKGIITCTFFAADYDQLRSRLRSKLLEVVQANPWMLGRFKTCKTRMDCPTTVPQNSDETLLDSYGLWLPDGGAGQGDSRVSRSSPYPVLNKAVVDWLGPLDVATTMKAFKNKRPLSESSLFRFTMLRVNPEECAVLFGMSHYVGDAHTYYKILNMLGPEQKVEAMEIRRVIEGRRCQEDISASIRNVTGKQADSFNRCVPLHLVKSVLMSVFKKKGGRAGETGVFFLDNEKIADRKRAELQGIAETNASGKQSMAQFVSTSDIIASDFAVASEADVFIYVVNFRNRVSVMKSEPIPLCDDSDAGNYVVGIPYDRPSYISPVRIRESLIPRKDAPLICKSSPDSFPGLFRVIQMSCLSNWATFPLHLDGGDAKTLLHLPCLNLNMSASNYLKNAFELAYVFRATPDRLGFMVVSNSSVAAKYAKESSILGCGVLEAGAVFDNAAY